MIERDARLEPRYASQLHGAPSDKDASQATDAAVAPLIATAQAPATSPHTNRNTGMRAAWIISLLTMGLVLGVVIVGVMKFLNGPVSSAGKTTLAQAQATVAPKALTNQLAGQYFDMTFPAMFDQVGHMKNDTQTLERYTISSKKDYRRVMAVTVRPLESNNAEDDASYKYRLVNPSLYKETKEKLNGDMVQIMTKNDSTEVTLFYAHVGKLLTLSITSNNPDDVVADFMKAVEPTLRWRT